MKWYRTFIDTGYLGDEHFDQYAGYESQEEADMSAQDIMDSTITCGAEELSEEQIREAIENGYLTYEETGLTEEEED